MAITIRLPVVVDAKVLRLAFAVAAKTGSAVHIETFYRVLDGPSHIVDCDSEREVLDFAGAQESEHLAAPEEGATP